MPRERLDLALVKLGLVPSREQAKRLIMAGEVSVMGRRITQPGWLLRENEQIVLRQPPKYVSRGGLKLEGALEHFGIDVAGMTAFDVGASTGGFTDCLLQRGATKVFAYDVGTNQLAWKLRSDPRVISREQFNLRHMKREDVGQEVDILVADLSFISLTLVLPAALQVLRPGGHAVVLIKPQFELSRGEIGKGGIVREPELHAKACARIEDFVRSQPQLQWRGLIESSIQGTEGNREFLAWFTVLA
ncbi:TlyA family RNA methyltransferase [Prosthecobacter sp.]|uniref:TlyA family RNA methyltransferase n=1 Tax=Prosthecobacter sp. TaxID=1965333 RepID=UPI002AB81074|nr:TlyA family RNA methyltransferase [Prosthecobacter sp.]MDZ4405165.1 TlyA family RNA methyltransferase [Prosthecobacter sp.]